MTAAAPGVDHEKVSEPKGRLEHLAHRREADCHDWPVAVAPLEVVLAHVAVVVEVDVDDKLALHGMHGLTSVALRHAAAVHRADIQFAQPTS